MAALEFALRRIRLDGFISSGCIVGDYSFCGPETGAFYLYLVNGANEVITYNIFRIQKGDLLGKAKILKITCARCARNPVLPGDVQKSGS